MGAFVLINKNTDYNSDNISHIFTKKGFSNPDTFEYGNYRLIAYKKQLTKQNDYSLDSKGNFIFIDGTLIYRGNRIQKSRTEFLQDFLNNTINFEEIIGSYCALIFSQGKWNVILDSIGSYHLFVNDDKTIYSSSFLALLVSNNDKYKLNRQSLLENLASGFIIGPETIVHGISVIPRNNRKHYANDDLSFYSDIRQIDPEARFTGGFDRCVNLHVDMFRNYFQSIRPAVEELNVDMGLSGGYDSRLIAALAHDAFPDKLQIHTHSTLGVHTEGFEKSVALRVAKSIGKEVKSIPNNPPLRMYTEEVENNLFDSLYYFDGRTNHCMGNYHHTNTKHYRIGVLNGTTLGLNGLVGEIFRNFDGIASNTINFDQWLNLYYLYPGFHAAFDSAKSLKDQIISTSFTKIYSLLDITSPTKTSHFTARRYIGEVKNAYNYSIKANAEHQLAYFLMPYGEYNIVSASYLAENYFGFSGKYQTQIIERINPRLASIENYFGFPMNHEPLKYLFGRYWRHNLPYGFRKFKQNRKGYLASPEPHYYQTMIDKSSVIRKSINTITSLFPEVRWQGLFWDDLPFSCAAYLGCLLNEFSEHISLE